MKVAWHPTSAAIYFAILNGHADMRVHASCTDMESSSLGGMHIMTEWGLPGADAPIIKIDRTEQGVAYYLAVVKEDEE